MANNSKEDKLEGWTTEEKFQLLEALRKVGSSNIEQIKEYVSFKTANELRVALDFYKKKRLARDPKVPNKHKKERTLDLKISALSAWAKFINDTHGFDQCHAETATTLRLIAEFEDKPPAVMTENIDFRKIYETLADALEGKPLTKDRYACSIISKCVLETLLTSKTFGRSSISVKNIIQSSYNPEVVDISAFCKPTEDTELATLRYLCTKRNYNPFNIPEKNLRSSTMDI